MKIEIFEDNKLSHFYYLNFISYCNFIKNSNENEKFDYLKYDFQMKNLLNNLIKSHSFKKKSSKTHFKLKFGIDECLISKNENNLLGTKTKEYIETGNLKPDKIFKFEDFLINIEKYNLKY